MSGRNNQRSIGNLGEEAVCCYLQKQGAQILSRNFTVRGGEIDIIACKDDVLLFVEVKTRRTGALQSGAEAVTPRKQQLIVRTAMQYLLKHPYDYQPRFDVAEVEYSGSAVQNITYLENAFDATGLL
ncbi:MAG: YraN family protein [Oscillospiraceae bacterium]|nr:YraN family protein [Oscillospiraceae bacterium]